MAKSKSKPKTKIKAKAKTTAKPRSAAKPKKKAAKKAAPKKVAPKRTASKKTAPPTKATASVRAPALKKSAFYLSPLADRIVVRVDGPSERTAGGLYIPATVEDRPHQGEVVACGPGSKNKKGNLKPLDVKKGDVVLFSAYAGTKAEVSGEEVLILREEDVLGVLA